VGEIAWQGSKQAWSCLLFHLIGALFVILFLRIEGQVYC
jgi:hypothetical protein